MSVSSYRFIDPFTLTAISDLQLVAKTVIDGFMLGVHQSPRLGVGLEFNQYRSYQPGDDPRRIDWKMYARSDRFFVRESEVETSVSVRFVLDATASMRHEDSGLSKFDYARLLIASLAYLASQQGDAVGLTTVQNRRSSQLQCRRGQPHLHRILHELEGLQPEGLWPEVSPLTSLQSASQLRELVVFVTDFHQQRDEIRKVVSELSAVKNEVLLFHLLGKNELEFDFTGPVTFEDLESGQTVEVNPDKSREFYLECLEKHLRVLEEDMHDQHVSYDRISLDQPLDFALRNYLTQRLRH